MRFKAMPSEFVTDRSALRFLTSVDSEEDYRNSLADRATSEGDKNLIQNLPVFYGGIGIKAIPMMPENLGTPTKHTDALLVDPMNLAIGFWRQIKIRSAEDIREGNIYFVISCRADCTYKHEPAAVIVNNLRVST